MRAASIPAGRAGPLPKWWWPTFLAAAAAANVVVAVALGNGKAVAAVPLALLPIALLAFGALLSGHALVLACIALGLNFTNLALLTEPLPVGGGTAIYATDLILMLAVGAWIATRLTRHETTTDRPPLPLAVTWPLLGLAIFVMLAIVHGNERYGTGFFGQPIRIVIYAGIAVSLANATADALWRGITIVFYGGAVLQFLFALLNLATGGSQTDSLALSTGGIRVLALSSAIYLVGSLVCALLNLERAGDRFSYQVGHAAVAGVALFGIVVSFGRTTYAAVAVILPALLLARKALRRSVVWLLPIIAPALIAVILLVPLLQPTLTHTLFARLGSSPSSDINVEWRRLGVKTALDGIDQHLLTGFGFGRPVRFMFLGQLQDLTGDPHNSFVYLLAGGGVLALGALLAVMAAYVADVARRLRGAVGVEQSLLIWSLCTWFAFMVNAFYGPVLTDATMLMTIWILMSVPRVVPVRGRRRELVSETAPQVPRSTSGSPASAILTVRS